MESLIADQGMLEATIQSFETGSEGSQKDSEHPFSTEKGLEDLAALSARARAVCAYLSGALVSLACKKTLDNRFGKSLEAPRDSRTNVGLSPSNSKVDQAEFKQSQFKSCNYATLQND